MADGMKVAYRDDAGVLVMTMSGRWTGGAMHEAIVAARAEAGKRKLGRLLVDARELSAPQVEVDRFFAGVRWAEQFPAPFRAAFVVSNALYNGFAELVARNRGARVSAHFDEQAARKWLRA